MKSIIFSFAAVIMFMTPMFTQAQKEAKVSKKTQEVQIATNLHCADCKAKIEADLAYAPGVKTVEANVETKVVTVKFNPKKTSTSELVQRIQKLGYQAKSTGGCCPSGSTEGSSGCKGTGSGEGSGGCKGKQGGTEGSGCGGKH